MRTWIALLMFLAGLILAAVSYVYLATPLGPPISPIYSNPRLVGAPGLFILGVVLVFLSAVVYELAPDRQPTAHEVEARRMAPSIGSELIRGSRN